MKKVTRLFLLLCLCSMGIEANAAKVKKVTAKYTYVVTDNENITLRDAKRKCVELARVEAIKNEFGQVVASDAIDVNVQANDKQSSSYYWESTTTQAKGLWLGDTREPKINVAYDNGNLLFTAEVWGEAREIKTNNIDMRWLVMHEAGDRRVETSTFSSGERLFVDFQTSKDGYVAIYLKENEENTYCLLPYGDDTDGTQSVKMRQQYTFFDKETDKKADRFVLKTKREEEENLLVMIYSPNPFTKSIDQPVPGSAKLRRLSTSDFDKWLLKCLRNDPDMSIERKWVTIKGGSAAVKRKK